VPRLSFLSFSSLISSLEHVLPVGDQGKNVNGWHWNEKDSFPWFKHQFTENFDDTVLFEGATNGPAGMYIFSYIPAYLHKYNRDVLRNQALLVHMFLHSK
jgi:hypothetical protein